ncbi:MAG: hypothetical protein J6M38_13120, partial [Lentisphaeria bacterium]|nr:hypothetical protein [Lentisphaeria bacterium]
AQRVPVPTGSLTQLVAIVNGEVTADDVNGAMKAAASASPNLSPASSHMGIA